MANTSANYRIKLAAVLDTKTVNQQISQLNKNNTLKELKIKVTISDASLKKIKELNDLLNKTEALNKYTSGLKNIQDTMKSYEKIASKVVTASNNVVKATSDIGNAAKNSEPKLHSFGEKAVDAFQKFSLWSAISTIFYKVVQSVQELINVAVELDSAFTELQKVTDLTIDDFDNISAKAYNLGSEVAKTTTEVVNAMTEFAKAGYSVEESTDVLARNALMWTNIADGTVNASESANMIISIMKAFNVDAENTIHIIDALNEVSNNFAVSSGDLSNSLTKSSAVLANAGVTFEEQIGLITAGTEILRNANTVSNGLKTISLRLQGMEEDGEAVDGLSAKLEEDFKKLGLTLYDTSGAIKSTYEIMEELSEVYPLLTEAEKAYFTELIAGKNRAQVAAAILNNFNTAINATETAMDSAGSAIAENEKYLNSIQGKLQAVRSEFEKLAASSDLNNLIKTVLDLTAGVLQLVNALGGLKGALILAITLIGIFNTQLLITIGMKVGAFFATFISGFKSLLYIIPNAIAALKTYNAGIITTQTLMGGLVPVIGLVVLAITGIIAIVNAATVSFEEQQEKVRELSEELREYEDELKSVNEKIEENNKLIAEINSKPLDIIDENTLNTLILENAQLEIQRDYLEEINDLKKDALGKETKKLLEKETDRTLLWMQSVGGSVDGDALASAPTARLGFNSLEEMEYLLNAREDLKKAIATIGTDEFDVNKINERFNLNVKTESAALAQLNKMLDTNTQYLYERADVLKENKDNLSKNNEEQKKYYDLIVEYENRLLAQKTYETDFNEFKEIYDAASNEQKILLKELEEQGKLTADNFKKYFPDLTIYFEAIGLSIDDVIKKIKNLVTHQEIHIDTFEKNLGDLGGFIGEAVTKYDTLKSAIEEYRENGELSAQTISTLIEKYPKYLELLYQENFSLDAVREALKKESEGYIAAAEAANLSNLQHVFGAEATLESAKATLDQAKANYIEATSWKDLKTDIAGYQQALLDLETIRLQEATIEDYEARLKIINDLKDQLLKGLTTGNSTKKSSDPWLEAFNKAYNELKNLRDRDIIDTATYYSELDKLNNKYFKDRVKYEEQFVKYKLELYKGMQEQFDEEIDKFDHQIAMMEYNEVDTETLIAKHREAQARIHKQAEYYRELDLEGNKDLIDELEELWWKYQTDIEKLQEEEQEKIKERFETIKDVAIDAIETEIKEWETYLEEKNALLDEEIARYEEENDALDDQTEIQEKLLAIEEARKKLAEAKNTKVRVYREGKGFVYETDFDAVAEAQSELDSLLEEWDLFQEKSKIADIIAQLEAEKEANEKRVEEEIEALNKLKDEWDKSLDISEDIEEYKAYLEQLGEEEQNSFDERLQAVKDFTAAYKAEMATLNSVQSGTTTSSPSGINYASGQRGSGKDSYNVYTDYQKLLNEAIASGAPGDHLVYLEEKRNNKIDGEGLSYEKTYNYAQDPNKPKKSSTKSSGSSSGSSSKAVSQPAAEKKSSGGSLLSTVVNVVKNVAKAVKSATGLATGTDNADGLMHFVGENGPELYVPPKGSGIIPNPNTMNLMAWGSINPMDLVKSFADGIGGTNVQIGNITLPNVKDANSFVEELKNFKGFAIQKQSVRR